jgi:Spy/CpxP family protein refolding chaperone
MRDPFLIVVIGVSVLALVGAVIALATSGGSYDRIGRGGLSIGDERQAAPRAPTQHGSSAERDAEIRQLLEARNARRAARGEAPVDVEQELRSLTAAPAADPELAAEVRQLVEARNARRIARGQPPLDVDAEIARRLTQERSGL